MKVKVQIVKCRCGDSVCNKYGLSDGTFYNGNGWDKERAQQYADAINSVEELRQENARLKEHVKDLNHDMQASINEANWQHSQGDEYGSY